MHENDAVVLVKRQQAEIERLTEGKDNITGGKTMTFRNLCETSEFMVSTDYKERFVAEYVQTKIRYQKLHRMLVKHDAGKLDFVPTCGVDILRDQKRVMGMYLNELEIRAEIEGIELPKVEV